MHGMYEAVRLTVEAHVADLVLTGPAKGNAMGPAFFRDFPLAVKAAMRDPAVRALVVRSEGDHFTYGLDLPAMMSEMGPLMQGGLAQSRTALYEKVRELQGTFDCLADGPKPVIAALHGWCIGGGLDLATACDVRVCSKDARFSVREVRVAMVADLGSLQRLPYIVGEGHARELALTGRDFDAARALRIGLVNDVHEDKQATHDAARAIAREIADNPPLVVQGVKQVMERAKRPVVQAGLEHVAAWNAAFLPSEDLGEAFTAFMTRRKPEFRGA
ncbi:MAG: crotonase/enoyl-CoA hydratase family protein [Myxococcales bacterium]|nr:crotonase/enoyl-CoA hydratase family protein [Myxococcales bacterium]